MPGWKKILCPIDFSATSRIAMHEALELAKRHGAEVYLLHVLEDPRPAIRGELLTPPEFMTRLRETAREDLASWKSEADEIAPGKTITEMIGGHAATEIARVARESDFDLVVMGTHGRRGLRRLFIGSVTGEIVRTAPCSVLVVRPGRHEFEVQPD
jgi:nucleotide-binding universal stress UspA family protein